MTIIGPGLTLVGGQFNTSLLAVAFHSTTPPGCNGLETTAQALDFPVLYVHTRGYSHGEMTIFNSLRKLSSNILEGVYEPWIQPKFIMHLDCFDNFLAMPPERILEQMAEFDTDLLISGEENCWPDPTQVWSGQNQKAGLYLELFESSPHIRTPNCPVPDLRFANLGGIIGTPLAVYDMSDWVLARFPDGQCTPGEPWPNDQACLHRYVLEGGMDRTGCVPHLDCGHIFLPMWNLFMGNIFPFVHLEKSSSTWPAVFHTNGHVTKPINTELKKCLSEDKFGENHGIEFPLVLERTTLEEGDEVAQQILLPLCRHLKNLTAGMGGTNTSTESGSEHDNRVFEWL